MKPEVRMPIGLEVILAARKYRIGAVERILTECYPRVHRIAYGLSGREASGRGIVRQVMRTALRQLSNWGTEGEPERWFDHHTILLWRRVSAYPPGAKEDLLVREASGAPAGYTAYIRALRQLPVQQREAYLLSVGEGDDVRRIGIAMDCSRVAAGNHLAAARSALEAMSGGAGALEQHEGTLRSAWASLGIDGRVVPGALKRNIQRHVWGRRLRRVIKIVLILIIVILVAWAVFKATGPGH